VLTATLVRRGLRVLFGDLCDGEPEPHEVERLFFGHCRMEPPWTGFDFAVDVSEVYEQKIVEDPTVFAPARFG